MKETRIQHSLNDQKTEGEPEMLQGYLNLMFTPQLTSYTW